jgi:GDP-4-dehydro-6-deoxy-D-mannose reductase
MRDFLDVADVVDAYVRTIRSADALPAGAVMNLSSGKALRIGDMLETLLSLSRAEIRVETDPARLRPSDTPVVIGDSARAADLLGWKPAREISGTLAAVLDYWRTRTAG